MIKDSWLGQVNLQSRARELLSFPTPKVSHREEKIPFHISYSFCWLIINVKLKISFFFQHHKIVTWSTKILCKIIRGFSINGANVIVKGLRFERIGLHCRVYEVLFVLIFGHYDIKSLWFCPSKGISQGRESPILYKLYFFLTYNHYEIKNTSFPLL